MAAAKELTIAKLATVTGIDAKSVAITTLYTVPPGKRMIPMGVLIRCTGLVGAKTVHVIASFGSNSATWNNYISSVTYTITAAQMCIYDAVFDAEYTSVAAGGLFKISIETGSNAATSDTWSVSLFGFLV